MNALDAEGLELGVGDRLCVGITLCVGLVDLWAIGVDELFEVARIVVPMAAAMSSTPHHDHRKQPGRPC